MFWIDGKDIESNVCPCCGGNHASYKTLDEMAYDCTVLSLNRVQREKGLEPFVTRKALANRDDVEFLEAELRAALALAEDALELVPEIEDIITPHLKEAMNANEVYDAMYRADDHWRRNSFKKGTASKFEEAITLSLATGVATANDAVFVPKLFREDMINGMVRSGKYYSNEFFNNQVMPSLINAVERVIYGDEAGARASYEIVKQVLNRRLKSVPYWNVVANAAASRSYHYGLLRAGQFAGRSTFRFEAVMDRRTSDICRHMHGREWTVSTGLSLMQRVAAAEHPEDVKNITPWVKASEVEQVDERALADMGVMVPPLHGRCRSTIVLI